MEREAILQVLRANQDNCILAFHRVRPGCSGYTEGKLLIRHYGGLIPDEIVLKPVMFLKVQGDLCVTERWGNDSLGVCMWRLSSATAGAAE
ncbi:hypothetical protein [Pantoea agglomerans]|uniref:hypothetical protein n=1 Tax=Enterobacter agglomerans TaxID=549 RepID=UPI0032078B3F